MAALGSAAMNSVTIVARPLGGVEEHWQIRRRRVNSGSIANS